MGREGPAGCACGWGARRGGEPRCCLKGARSGGADAPAAALSWRPTRGSRARAAGCALLGDEGGNAGPRRGGVFFTVRRAGRYCPAGHSPSRGGSWRRAGRGKSVGGRGSDEGAMGRMRLSFKNQRPRTGVRFPARAPAPSHARPPALPGCRLAGAKEEEVNAWRLQESATALGPASRACLLGFFGAAGCR